jgi:hypothetical protein
MKIETFLGPEKSRFSGPTPSNAPGNDVAPLKIIMYRAIKTTGTLVVLCTRVLLCSVVVCCCVKEGWGGLLAAVFYEEVFRGWGWLAGIRIRDPG